MNCRERFLTALDLGKPDRVPIFDWIDEAVSVGVLQTLGLEAPGGVSSYRKGEETEQSIDVALIGTCTNGRLDDIRQAAAILRGQTVAKGIRLLVAPASRQVYLAAEREGLFRDIVEAGGSVYAPNCGPCVSLTQKLISGDGEVIISNANRNFKGRLGNAESEIWIASSATVAASALTGKLTDPREVEGGTWRPV